MEMNNEMDTEMDNEMDSEMDNEMDNEIEMMMINEQATMLRLFTAGGSSSAGHQDRLQPWTLEEMAVFDAALAQHGKDFSQVAQNVNKNPTHPIPIIMITLIIHSFFLLICLIWFFLQKKWSYLRSRWCSASSFITFGRSCAGPSTKHSNTSDEASTSCTILVPW